MTEGIEEFGVNDDLPEWADEDEEGAKTPDLAAADDEDDDEPTA